MLPTTIYRFRNGGDKETADLLETVVYPEEITHCAAGVKWFKYLCSRSRDLVSGGDSEEVGAGESKESDEVIRKFSRDCENVLQGPSEASFQAGN